jgi:23S rRNA G2445 N2-methylase RlmL
VIEKAKRNAQRARVADTIVFETKRIEENRIESAWIITNPPYGIRLKESDVVHLHTELDRVFEKTDISG